MFANRDNLRIKDIEESLLNHKKRLRISDGKCSTNKSAKRYLVFDPVGKYTLIRSGSKDFEDRNSIDENDLNEDVLFHFRHNDPWITRSNKYEPRYVSVFKVDEQYLIPHQIHFKEMYSQCGRTNYKKAKEIMDDKTPYWADVYMNRILKEHADKKKYRQRKKRDV